MFHLLFHTAKQRASVVKSNRKVCHHLFRGRRLCHEPLENRLLLSVVPNDPLFPNQWGFDNTSQTGGTWDADIDAPAAWSSCFALCCAERENRSLQLPLGTVGGRIPWQKTPRSSRAVQAFITLSGPGTKTGIIWSSPGGVYPRKDAIFLRK